MIELVKIEKRYRSRDGQEVAALRGIDLTIEEGAFLAITGPSGCGKSTLLNILGCLDVPDGGHYRLKGQEIADLSDDRLSRLRAETFGFVFQAFHLLPSLSSRENVSLPLLYRKGFEPPEGAAALLGKLDLSARVDHLPSELSGGQQQRVAIARALVGDPEVLIADEPTGNLDSRASAEILELLETLHEAGKTIIMVTHDPAVAARAVEVVEMLDGQIVREGGAPPSGSGDGAGSEQDGAGANRSEQGEEVAS